MPGPGSARKIFPWQRRTRGGAWQTDPSPLVSVKAKVGSFVKPTSGTGAQVVSRVGFRPKAIILWTSGGITSGIFNTVIRNVVGFACGTSDIDQFVYSNSAHPTTSGSGGRKTRQRVFSIVTSSPSTFSDAVLQSFDGDGFTLNWIQNDIADATIIHYWAIGGTNVKANVNWFPMPATGTSVPITGLGFAPNLVFFTGGGQSAPFGSVDTGFAPRIGVATPNGMFSTSVNAQPNVSPTTAARFQRSGDRAFVGTTSALVQSVEANISAWGSDGYTYNSLTSPGASQLIGVLALSVPNVAVGVINKTPTGGANNLQSILAGFPPVSAMLFSFQGGFSFTPVTNARMGMGAATFDPLAGTYSVASSAFELPDAINPFAGQTIRSIEGNVSFFLKVNTNTGVVDAIADPPTFSSNSVDWNWSTNDAAVTEIGYVIIGDYVIPTPTLSGSAQMLAPAVSALSLPGWTQANKGAAYAVQAIIDSTDNGASLYCPNTGEEATIFQAFTVIPGMMYRIAGKYDTPATNKFPTEVWIEVQEVGGPRQFTSDGRTTGPDGRLLMSPTYNGQRNYTFDILIPAGITQITVRFGCSAGGPGSRLNVYSCYVYPIYTFAQFENRLSETSVGDTEQGASPYVGDQTLGVGSVSVIISDGVLQQAMPTMLMINKRARLISGGSFIDGQEILRENCRTRFYGFVKDFDADDDLLRLDLEDARLFLKTKLPRETYTFAEFPDAFINRVGYGRPIVCGVADLFPDSSGQSTPWIDPTRIGLDGTTKYGLYEYAYGAGSPAGMFDAPEIRAYETQDAATFSADSGHIVSSSVLNLNSGWFLVTDNIKAHNFNGGSKIAQHTLDFDIGAGALGRQGNLSWTASEVAAAETAAWGNGITITYDHSSHIFQWSRGATINLRPSTGTHANSAQPAWASLGIKTDVDKTGSLTYRSDDPTLSDVDKDHIILVRTNGFKDDAVGTYTGTPGGLIKLAPDIVRMLLQHYVRIPASQFDLNSFLAARSGEGANPCFYFQQFIQTVEEILKRFEATMLADITVDGDGTIRVVPYKNTVAPVRAFTDDDYETWKMGKRWDNVKSTVTLYYGYDPHRDRYASVVRTDPATFARIQIDDPFSIYTWLAYSGAAGSRADDFLKLYTANPDVATFTARGKLVDLKIGDKILLTRASAWTSGGALDRAEFRVRYIRFNDTTGLGECHAVRSVTL